MEPGVTIPIVAADGGRWAGSDGVAPSLADLLGKMEIVVIGSAGGVRAPSTMKKAVKPIETAEVRDSRTHTELFAQAMKIFGQGDYKRADALFAQASVGPLIGVNESAQMYSRMCQQRINRMSVELKTPDDHYNYAVSLINARKYREARESLVAALEGGVQPHYCYALALVEGHLGAMDAAASQLRRAIQMDSSLRSAARNDPDFAPLLQNSKMKEALASAQGTGG